MNRPESSPEWDGNSGGGRSLVVSYTSATIEQGTFVALFAYSGPKGEETVTSRSLGDVYCGIGTVVVTSGRKRLIVGWVNDGWEIIAAEC